MCEMLSDLILSEGKIPTYTSNPERMSTFIDG
jgi:hypothetical protein